MANIKKNFNFRNGVQVDDDNLLVTSTGLVGIGTTVPTEALDVRGDVTVTGFASITSGNIGFLTVTTLEPVQIIGTGVSIKSGIVTAEGTGIVTFFGDARFLQGMPTSQWEDVDVGLGYTSIFNTGGNVGIATNDPRFSLEVGGKVDAGNRGVGISSVGNIRASGIITAVSFVGDLTGNIVSPSTFSGNIDLNADIDVDGHTNLDNVSITGVTTSSGNVDLDADLDVDGHTNLDNVSVSGVTTFATGTVFSGNIDINADIDVDGHTNLDNVSVSGVSTFTGLVDANGGSTIDNIQIGISGDNEIDTSTGNLTIDSAGGTVTIDDDLGVTGIATFSQNVAVTGLTTTRTFQVVETSTFGGDIRGTFVGTSSTVFATKLGVGTTEAPVTEIQVRKSGDAEIQITSETGTAIVSIGRTTNQVNGTNAEMRYGGRAGQAYSTPESFDLVNHGKDNFNYYLAQSNASSVRGDFHWLKGVSTRLMTLTNTGRLGIGITQPTAPLQVIGNSNISGDAVFGGDVNVTGTVFSGVEGNITGDVTGTLFGNVDASNVVTTAESKFKRVIVSGVTTTADVVINEKLSISGNYLNEGHRLNINTTDEDKFIVTNAGKVGIGTTDLSSKLTVNGDVQTFESLTVGATARQCAVDFANAGKNVSGTLANKMFMLPPRISTTQRNALTGLVSGALIYNTSTNKLQVYDGSGWDNCN
mgnify:CR=1 FL=1